jgi:hypothetical protein
MKRYYLEINKLPESVMPNYVMVKLDGINKDRRTKGGIYITSGRSDDVLDNLEIFNQIDRHGTVVKVPPFLIFEPGNQFSLAWKTKIEVEIGDRVWMRQIEANVASRVKIGENYYKIVRYDSLNVAKRGDKVIPLNGQVLMQQIFKESSKLIKQPFRINYKDRGIVKYCGTPNEDYIDNYYRKGGQIINSEYFTDEGIIKEGDIVHYQIVENQNMDEIFLESELFPTFGEKVKLCQRRHIILKSNI